MWQLDWRGAQLQNLRILVCKRKCLDIPQEQLRAYSPPADPIPIRDPRPDLSIQGNGPTVITTIACAPAVWLRDGYGNLILDGYGNPIMTAPGTYGTLLPADPNRTIVQFAAPTAFGLFINPTGGACDPVAPGVSFYAPSSSFQAFNSAATSAMTYFTTIAGLTIVVETQDGGIGA